MKVLKNFTDKPNLEHLIRKYKIKFDVFEQNNVCELNIFVIPEEYRGRGIGSKVMTLFCEWLDENEYACKLLASNKLGSDLEYLINFYSKYDFNLLNYDGVKEEANFYRENI